MDPFNVTTALLFEKDLAIFMWQSIYLKWLRPTQIFSLIT
jgi:hypothetical protein